MFDPLIYTVLQEDISVKLSFRCYRGKILHKLGSVKEKYLDISNKFIISWIYFHGSEKIVLEVLE